MRMKVEEDYNEAATFQFETHGVCTEDIVCLNELKKGSSITFNGMLTEVPKQYTATLKDGKLFTFAFGTGVASPPGNGSDSNNGGNEQETVGTTSRGDLIMASKTVLLFTFVMLLFSS